MTIANTSKVISTISKFFYDKHNLKVFETIKEPELTNISRAVFIKVNDDCKMEGVSSLDLMNIRAMSALKEAIRFKLMPVAAPVETPTTLPDKLEMAIGEDEFVLKMRMLEDNRKVLDTAAFTPPPAASLQLAHPLPIGTVLPATAAAPAPPPQQVPVSLKPSTTVALNGWDRQVAFSPKRNVFVWAGPIAPAVSRISVDALLLPDSITAISPYVVLEIQGVGGQTETIHFVPRGAGAGAAHNYGGSTAAWAVYDPVSAGHFITALACPWTLKLLDAFHKPLEMGEDTVVVKQALAPNRLVVNHHGDLAVKHIITIDDTNGQKVNCCVNGLLKEHNGQTAVIELSQDVGMAAGSTITNIQKQFVVLMGLV